MKATLVRRSWENHDRTIMSFYFKPAAAYRYEAGQYADITIPHDSPDNRGITRTMTWSSGPHEELLCVTTRVTAEPLSTYKQSLLSLKPGDTVTITDPMGDMILPLTADTPLLFVAGGVGIASFSGMVSYLLANGEQRDITLLLAVASTGDIALDAPFNDYGQLYGLTRRIYTPAVNTPYANEMELHASRLTAADLAAAMKPETQIYLSGSLHMVESLRVSLETDYQIPQYQIAFDYFDGYAEA